MNETDKLRKLRDGLIAQDLPSPARASAHQETLLRKVHRRLQIEKGLVGAAYVAVFTAAFLSFLHAGHVPDIAKAVWWTACSMHILLWFLVFLLWRLERLICRTPSSQKRAGQTKRENRTVFICALAACAVGTAFLCGAGFLRDPLKVAQVSRYILWAPVFFLFWYPFGIATVAARLWLRFREMEILSARSDNAEGNLPATDTSSSEEEPHKPSP